MYQVFVGNFYVRRMASCRAAYRFAKLLIALHIPTAICYGSKELEIEKPW